ncbi:hypothetical protein ACA910_022577 [Epithemia clementina (nom. ined.)]
MDDDKVTGDDEAPCKIYMATVTAPTNIAVIKYWGKASVEYNTPTNASLSVTLDQTDLRAVTTVATSPSFTQDRLWLNGQEEEGACKHKRFRACIDGVKRLATAKKEGDGTVLVSVEEWQQWKVHVSSYNTFPTAAGLASSAAGYAALVAALTELYQAKETFPGELTTIARQGSGSACRSLFGGFVAWRPGTAENEWKDSIAEPIVVANSSNNNINSDKTRSGEEHWPELRAVILVVSAERKHTSSTTGMQTSVATSPLLQFRSQQVVPERIQTMEQAWRDKDFDTFAMLTMKDSNQFHATCLDTYPPIFYLNDTSRDIIRLISAYNEFYASQQQDGPKTEGAPKLRVAYTFDAGPNAVLYTTAPHLAELVQLVSHFFPAPTSNSTTKNDEKPYIRSSDISILPPLVANQRIAGDSPLLKHCINAMPESYEGTPASSGKVQYMYVTKAGPGPQVLLPSSLASTVPANAVTNLDPKSGLNTYTRS